MTSFQYYSMFIFTIAICNLYLYRKEPSRLYMVRLLRFTRRKCKQQSNNIVAMVTGLLQLWHHWLRSGRNGARVTVRSSPTPNVHRGERRYHVKRDLFTIQSNNKSPLLWDPRSLMQCIISHVGPVFRSPASDHWITGEKQVSPAGWRDWHVLTSWTEVKSQ